MLRNVMNMACFASMRWISPGVMNYNQVICAFLLHDRGFDSCKHQFRDDGRRFGWRNREVDAEVDGLKAGCRVRRALDKAAPSREGNCIETSRSK